MPSHRADPQVSRRHHEPLAAAPATRRANLHRPSRARAAVLTPHQGITVYDTDELYAAVYGEADTFVPSSFGSVLTGAVPPVQQPVRAPRPWWEADAAPEAAAPAPVLAPRRSPLSPLSPQDLAGGPAGRPAAAVPPAAAPLTRAALRASQGPLTSKGGVLPSRASRRAAERARPKRSTLSVSQVGIASALGLATIAAPLAGALATPMQKVSVEPLASIPAEAGPAAMFPRVVAPEANAVEEAKLVPGLNESSAVPKTLVAPREIFVSRVSRDGERAVLPGCDGRVPAGTTWSNGRIPAGDLCTLWERDHSLRADAAVALAKLNIAYKKQFGTSICLTDSYRSLSSQYRLRAIKPGLAAVPGTSQHGWGLAVDLCGGVDNYGSVTYRWLRANAPAYGWDNPDWALPGGSGPTEAWHWEYLPGEKVGPGSD